MPLEIVPAYFGPWSWPDWVRLLKARPWAAIFNPGDGPESIEAIEIYTAQLLACKQLRIHRYIYIPTGFGAVSKAELLASMELAKPYFDGVFFDQVDFDKTDFKGIHAKARAYSKSRHPPIYNPGSAVDAKWYNKYPGSIICTFEGTKNRLSVIPELPPGPMTRQLWVIYSTGIENYKPILVDAKDLGYLYTTTDGLPNPYDSYG